MNSSLVNLRRLVFGLAGLFVFKAMIARAQTPAFPGAQGYGANVTGGRGGTVYRVTNTNDSGAGSFRDAVSSSGRIVVFEVGGTIKLLTPVSAKGNLTIAGQTAPGGIKFDGGEISFSGRSNIICRYIRIRPGSDTAANTDDAIAFADGRAMIFDHCSIAFAPWNNVGAVSSDWQTKPVTDITFQHCINANPTYQQFGAHTECPNANWTWCYNLFANSHNRNPLAKVNTVFINNIEYNNSAGYTTHTSTKFKHDIVNNYFVAGPASSGNFPWYQIDNNQSMYFTGNLYDSDKNGVLGGNTTVPLPGYQGGGTILSSPFSAWTSIIPRMSTLLAWRYDISAAGAFPRDEVDSLIVSQVKTLGSGSAGTGAGTAGPGGGLYTSQTQTGLGNNGYGTITALTAPTDADADGMPDYWEQATGSPANSANALTNTANGYCLLENYLNWLAAPHAVTRSNTAVVIDLTQFSSGFSGATFSVTNGTNGSIAILNGTNAQFTPNPGFIGLAGFNFTVTEAAYSLNIPVVVCVTPIVPPASATQFFGAFIGPTTATNTVVVTPPQNLLWRGDGTVNAWNTTTSNWLNGATSAKFKDGDVVTFDDTGFNNPAIALNTTVAPGAMLFDVAKNYVLAGNGAFGGSGTFTKSGSGTVTIGTTNSGFSGPVFISGGSNTMNTGTSLGSGPVTLSGGSTLFLSNGNSAILIPGSVTVPAGENVTIASGYVANGGYGNFISGDTNSVLNLKGNQSFAGTSSAQFSSFNGTINIASGNIRFSQNSSGNTFGSLTPNFIINGTLQPRNAGNTVVLGALNGNGQLAGPQTAGTGSGNTVYNVGGKNLDAVFNGTIVSNDNSSGSAICFNKVGTGTQVLNGNNTCTGTNSVQAGTLLLNGTNTPSSCTVFANATLGGTGMITGPVTVNSGGRLAPGANGVGTLRLGNNLTLNTATLNFELSGSPTGANDRITLPGTLALSGAETFNFTLTERALGAGTYALIDGANNSTASGVTLSHNLPTSTRQSINLYRPGAGSNPSYLWLLVNGTAGSLVWSGTNGNLWDLTVTTNWLKDGSAEVFYNLDTVSFTDSSTNGNVTIGGAVQPATVIVSNNATTYSIGGGVFAGLGALTKAGTGALSLNASNGFTGGVTLSGGILHVNHVSALGVGKVTLVGGMLHYNDVDPGNAIVASGTNALQITSQSVNTYPNFTLSGSGRLNLTIDGNNTFSPGGNWTGYGGYIFFTGNNAMRMMSASVGSSNAVWDLGNGGGIYNRDGGYTVPLGALKGASGASISGASTAGAGDTIYLVGGLNVDCSFGGVISDNASPTALIKTGNATLTLTGANTFSGDTTVNSGTLRVDTTTGSGTGTGDLEISAGATLTGNGIVGSATTVDGGGILSPGGTIGRLVISNSLALSAGSTSIFEINKALLTNDAVKVYGVASLGGALIVTNVAGTLSGGESFKLVDAADYSGAFATVSLPPLPQNLVWDTSQLNVTGSISVLDTATLHIKSLVYANGSLFFTGTGGVSNGAYYVTASTNLLLSPVDWTYIATNQFDSSGTFNFNTVIDTNRPQEFFRLTF